MTDAPVRLLLIGAGAHASRHVHPNAHRLAHAETVGICDLDPQRAAAAAARWNIKAHGSDFQRMIADLAPDGVIICVGDKGHAAIGIEALRLGRHVYVEKPHAPDLAASLRMRDAARAAGRICMGAYKKRFGTAYRKAKAHIDHADFHGRTTIQVMRSAGMKTTKPFQDPSWLWQWGCHGTDLVQWLFGPVAEVTAVRPEGNWNAVHAVLRFASGAVGSLALNAGGASWEEVTALGGEQQAVQVRNSVFLERFHGNATISSHTPSFVTGSCDLAVEEGFLPEQQEFVAAIREGREPEAGIDSLTHTAALHEAIIRSASDGGAQRVAFLPQPPVAAVAAAAGARS